MAECLTLLDVEGGHSAGVIMVSSDSVRAVSAMPLMSNQQFFFHDDRFSHPDVEASHSSPYRPTKTNDPATLPCESQQVLRVHFSLLRRLPQSLIPPFLIELRTQINSFDGCWLSSAGL
jgi:hypothetical protein